MTRPASPAQILLVDDSRGDRRLVREYLGTAGLVAFAVTEAQTLAAALSLLKSGRSFDLVLLDLDLPDSWGLDTLSTLSAAAPRIPIVVFTGSDDEEQALRAIQAGAQDYLVKGPLTKTAIVRTVRHTIERYRLERALRESEEKFRTIADHTGDWEFWSRPDGSVVYMNPACHAVTGYTPEEFVDDPGLVERIVHRADLAVYQNHCRENHKPGGTHTPAECEFRIIHRDGQTRWIGHICSPVVGSDGGDQGQRVSNRDITTRKKAESLVATQLMRLASLLEITHYCATDSHALLDFSLQQALALTDSALGCLFLYDEASQELTLGSWSRDVMAGCDVAEPKIRASLAEAGLWGEAVRQRKSVVINDFAAPNPLKRGLPKGHLPLQRWLSVPVHHDGRIVAAIGLANKAEPYDETDVLQLSLLMEGVWRVKGEREAVEKVRLLNENLEVRVATRTADLNRALRELESFSYSVSHDLRAPLRSIDGFSQALLEDCADQLDATGKSYLERIRGASRRMATLIDDLLQLSRITRQPMEDETVDLTSLALQIVAELRAGSPDREVSVVIEPGLEVKGDARLLKVVLGNLLANAWLYTSRTPGARIEIGSRTIGKRREFFVRDNGVGFDPAYADKLFVAFQRLHSEAEFPGTGIGLAIVNRIIQRHGGEIRGESSPGEGAVFTFSLVESN